MDVWTFLITQQPPVLPTQGRQSTQSEERWRDNCDIQQVNQFDGRNYRSIKSSVCLKNKQNQDLDVGLHHDAAEWISTRRHCFLT
ncbi:hypothetical protein RRG08_049521 [Elysia crispata]|uniref:Uncharacterized protein n=1 Tax=Elysia crispata TaxID=231223 RepID=A0AAE0ZF03_9GAST|nr:hypothetical protein RRG08_049521 [Elysia crispata]